MPSKIKKLCPECGKLTNHGETWCSWKCANIGRVTRVPRVCIVCGKDFTIERSVAAKQNTGKYCSIACKVKLMRDNAGKPKLLPDGRKVCVACIETKNLQDFGTVNRGQARGVIYYNTKCKACVTKKRAEYVGEFRKKNGVSPETELASRSVFNFVRSLFRQTKSKSRRGGKPVDLTAEYLYAPYQEQDGLCAITGWPMTTVLGKGYVYTNISIDRIDSGVGYLKGNVHLTCRGINSMKMQMPLERLHEACAAVCRKAGIKVG